jgi:hypothetical protein
MRTPTQPHKVVERLLKARGLTFRQVSLDTGLPYKPLLREAKTGESRMSLDTAAVLAEYFDINIAVLTNETGEVAA